MMGYLFEYLLAVAKNFELDGDIEHIQQYGSGNINDTFLVSLQSKKEDKVILQRINDQVFVRPERIMSNMRIVTDHIRQRLNHEERVDTGRGWEIPRIFPAKDGKDYFFDSAHSCWRAMGFISGSTVTSVLDTETAREVGYGLGRFHSLASDLDTEKLYDTLEGFHITPWYLRLFDDALKTTELIDTSSREAFCMQFIRERRPWASVLEDAKEKGILFLRPIHGDPKFDNILLDEAGKAIALIDLDTVKPGLVHYDIGDCIRSCCNSHEEDDRNVEDVNFRTDFFRAAFQGYLSAAHDLLGTDDYAYLYDSIRLIAFELGLRFFTDYLKGNVYFKAKEKDDNLLRALVQFKLTESIESQESEIRSIIEALKPRNK